MSLSALACGSGPGASRDGATQEMDGAVAEDRPIRPDDDAAVADRGKQTPPGEDARPRDDAEPAADVEAIADAGPVQYLAFTSRRSGRYDIHIAPFPRGAARNLTPDTTNDYYPAWTPDGRALIYAQLGVDRITLQRVEVATASVTPVVARGLLSATAPSVSPDGMRIAFEGRASGDASAEIYTVPIGGGDPVRLTNNASADASPEWGPSGDVIYFVSNRGGAFEVYSMDANGANQTALSSGSAVLGRLAVDPMGGRLAFARSGRSDTELVFYDLATQRATLVPGSDQGDSEPRFSRDGRYLLVSATRFGGVEVAYFDLASGGAPVRVTMDPANDGQPALGPAP